ncbi:oligosaccharide flippase family protein, partial [Vibrio makurazakiensis]|uniref:oligosaccharide flippase family protein n=1 Tax=Vibrio makurazakiensis TaxID=2910250 RepID=UPI003D0F82D2
LLFYILTWFALSIYLFSSLEFEDALLVSLICLSNVFLGIDIYQFYLNGSLKSKLNATASMKAKLLSMSFRTIFVLLGLNVWWFIVPLLVEGLVIYSLKHRALINDIHNIDIEKSEVRKEYYSIGRLFFLSSLLVYIYSKSNEIFLKEISSFEDVGIYSIGVVLSASWIFIPLSIGTSFLTHANKKSKDELYTLTYFVMFMSSFPILLFIYMLAGSIVDLILGDKYMELVDILPIMALSSFFSCLGFITNRYVSVLDSSGRYILNKVAITAFFSVFLTYILVSNYGLIGAVISLLVIEFSNVTIGNYFYGKGKVFRVQIEVLLLKRNLELLFKTLKS